MARPDVLTGRVAVVTGGASGIGRGAVERFLAGGAEVLVVDVNAAAQAELEGAGARFLRADAGDPVAWRAVVDDALATWGRIDIAVLNAAVPLFEADVLAVSEAGLARAMAVNIGGVVHGIRSVVPAMGTAGGDIVAIASLAGLMPYGADPVYAMTKHAVVGLARSVARGLARSGVRVNSLCPGPVDTPLLPDDVRRSVEAAGLCPLTPAEVAGSIVEVLGAGCAGETFVTLPGRPLFPYEFAPVSAPVPATTRGAS